MLLSLFRTAKRYLHWNNMKTAFREQFLPISLFQMFGFIFFYFDSLLSQQLQEHVNGLFIAM